MRPEGDSLNHLLLPTSVLQRRHGALLFAGSTFIGSPLAPSSPIMYLMYLTYLMYLVYLTYETRVVYHATPSHTKPRQAAPSHAKPRQTIPREEERIRSRETGRQ